MTTLFDLLGYEVQTVIKEDGDDDYEDPAYIAPPLKPQEPERRSPKSLDFHGGLSPLGKMIAATDLMEFSDALDELQGNVIELCYHLNLLIVNDGFQTPELEPLQADLKALLTVIAPKDEKTVAAIAPQHSAIEDEIPTKKADPIPPDEPQTLKSGYIEEKTVRKNGKVVGVYLYQRWRENGKLKSKYLGSKPKNSAP